MTRTVLLPGLTVFERGWLSSNGILFESPAGTALVDSGYCTHEAQTLALVGGALGTRPLDRLLNTHLHSDHCGGNASLQRRYPGLRTAIPAGLAEAVARWDEQTLTYAPTGQACVRFGFDEVLRAGDTLDLADATWEVHAAAGHDPHSVMLFEPRSRTLISADALWENGFGVVFPELEGEAAFDDVAATLEQIERLAATTVIPGHGAVFGGSDTVAGALERARSRLASFVANPRRHAGHAAKVLIKFKLLEWQAISLDRLRRWALSTPYLDMVRRRYFGEDTDPGLWLDELLGELARVQALELDGDQVRNV